jgi:p38 MAP kinase
MADFVKLSIFGTVFEVTTRYVDLQPVGMGAFGLVCSAQDQLTNTSVAIKKIMKPFSTPVLSKRTYRELKLLKHIRHENVGEKKLLACCKLHNRHDLDSACSC